MHTQYGFKTVIRVFPNEICIYPSTQDPASVANITLSRKRVVLDQTSVEETADKRAWEGHGKLEEKYPTQWSILGDKGYQGLAQEFCTFHL